MFRQCCSTFCMLYFVGHLIKNHGPISTKRKAYFLQQKIHFYKYIHFNVLLTIDENSYFQDLTLWLGGYPVPPVDVSHWFEKNCLKVKYRLHQMLKVLSLLLNASSDSFQYVFWDFTWHFKSYLWNHKFSIGFQLPRYVDCRCKDWEKLSQRDLRDHKCENKMITKTVSQEQGYLLKLPLNVCI
jgi:hypothetical protein